VKKLLICLSAAALVFVVTALAERNLDRSRESERNPIQRLDQRDIEATLSDKADELAKLWDDEAVRIQSGCAAEIGKAQIYTNDKGWKEKRGRTKTLCYKPEIKHVRIADDWAFEWGCMSFKDSSNAKAIRGKMLRVMKRQPDGSWKFARVIVFDEAKESAAPMSHPCQ
jgi:ketosteroid isomerase-like protein